MRRYYLIPIFVVIAMVSIFANHKQPKYVQPVSVERGYVDWETAVKKSEQIKARQEQSEIKRTMDNSLYLQIIGTLGTIAVILFNPKFLELKRIVAEIREEVKHLKAPETLELELRKMTATRLEACRPELRGFINSESEKFINIVTEIVRGSFDYSGLYQAILKVELDEQESISESCKLGTGYCHLYQQHLSGITTVLKDQISDIMLDSKFNSKQSRFSLASQVYLRDKLKGITDIYEQVKNESK